MDKVEKLSVGVAKMELEHHARGEVIKHLREERADYLAASLRIRTLLAPLLGVDVNNEPADEMVGRLVAKTLKINKEVDQLRVQLAGCAVAAGDGREALECKPGDYGYSASYADVLALRRCMDLVRARIGVTLEDYEAAKYDAHAATLEVLERYLRENRHLRELMLSGEQRGHDKAMEWAATLAFDFDPFSEDWTDEQRGAGERVLGLFAERLRDEVGGGVTAWETTTLPESPSEATSWGVAVVDDQPAPPPSRPSSSPAGFYRVYDSNQTDAEAALYVKVTKAGEVWGYSEFEGVPGYRTLGRPWVSFATEPGNERMRWMPDRDRGAEQESLRAWNPPLVPAPSLDGGLTNEEVAAVRALLKREGE